MDKAGKKYWNDSWAASEISNAVDPDQLGLNNYVNRRFHEYFCEIFSDMKTRGMKLLEIGCAKSAWLPYFAKEFGFDVWGLDYSEIGCQIERQMLLSAGVAGKVICADLFAPPQNMLESFDVVISFGVVEHFDDTASCINSIAKFLKPGGVLITNIPNMVGLIGFIQKIINRPVFDIHVPLDKDSLFRAHQKSGLEILDCDYFISTNFGVCNLNGIPANTLEWFYKKIFTAVLARFSMTVWFVESKVGKFRAIKLMSPYVNCLARKPVLSLPGSDRLH